MTTATPTEPKLQTIRVSQLEPNPWNRKAFDQQQLEELAGSIKSEGVLQPLIARPHPEKGNGHYEIVAGERRWRASRLANLIAVPAIVRQLEDAEVIAIMAIENVQRENLHALDEGRQFAALMKIGGLDVAKIAGKVGRSVQYIYDRLRLLQLTTDAQKLFLAGKFTPAHAILLSRLRPQDQKRAIGDPDDAYTDGGLFVGERGFFDEEDEQLEAVKPVSVRELQKWIDEHVRFDPHAEDVPDLFPETATTVQRAAEVEEKIVHVTHAHYVQPEAREGSQRIYGPRSWKRADGQDGSKTCEHAVTGVIVAGFGRGDAFKVCIAKKKCATHWGQEQREAKERAKHQTTGTKDGKSWWEQNQEKQRERNRRREEEHARWKKATPALLEAIAAKLKGAATGPDSAVGQLVLTRCRRYGGAGEKTLMKHLPRGRTAEDVVRFAAFQILTDSLEGWNVAEEAPRALQPFGIEAKAIVNQVAPKPKESKEAKKTKTAERRKKR